MLLSRGRGCLAGQWARARLRAPPCRSAVPGPRARPPPQAEKFLSVRSRFRTPLGLSSHRGCRSSAASSSAVHRHERPSVPGLSGQEHEAVIGVSSPVCESVLLEVLEAAELPAEPEAAGRAAMGAPGLRAAAAALGLLLCAGLGRAGPAGSGGHGAPGQLSDEATRRPCPAACHCLGDLLDCSRRRLIRLPDPLPAWVTRL